MFHIFFTLENDNIIFYGVYIVHIHCHCERGVIHTKIVSKCYTKVYVYRIAYFPFHSVFLSVSFSVPRFSNTKQTPAQIVHFSSPSRTQAVKNLAHSSQSPSCWKYLLNQNPLKGQFLVLVGRLSYFATNFQHVSDFQQILHAVTVKKTAIVHGG